MDHLSVNVSNLKETSMGLQRVNKINIVLFLKKNNGLKIFIEKIKYLIFFFKKKEKKKEKERERSGSVVECLTRDRGAAG